MTFTSDEMINAAAMELVKAGNMNPEQEEAFTNGFYSGSLWAIEKRQCKMIDKSPEGASLYDYRCENCDSQARAGVNYCWNCGCKFIKDGE